MENIAKLKSYRSFRIPVKSSDKVYLNLVRCDGVGISSDHVKWELQNVSLTGVAFQTSAKFDEDSVLEVELKYKRFHFFASAKVIRISPIYNEFSEIESYQYGVEFFTQDQENGREFISQFISGFSTKRLKRHLINLLINESRINTFSDGQKLNLSMNLFTDMKQFKSMEEFLPMIFLECCRVANSEAGNIYLLNTRRNKLKKLDIENFERKFFCNIESEDFINEVLSTKRYKVLKSKGHLSLKTFPSESINEQGVDFKQALYFPLVDSQGKVKGVFEFINFTSERGYTDRDLGVIEIFSHIFTMCYENLDKGDYVNHLLDNIDFNLSGELIGASSGIDHISEFIQSSKDSRTNILIQGNHGVGKIHIAKNIHEQSDQANMSFGQIQCEEIYSLYQMKTLLHGDSENVGRLELYAGGTILLHEPSLLKLEIQDYFLEELSKRDDIRILTTSVEDLKQLVSEDKFSKSLYKYISQNAFFVEDLKNRKSDIPLLINHFLDYYCSIYGLPSKRVCPDVMEVFKSYSWPGNVAELQQTIERFVNYYPYIRFLDELPQKEFPIIGHYARQFGVLREMLENNKVYDKSLLLDKLIENYCRSHKITVDDFYQTYGSLETVLKKAV